MLLGGVAWTVLHDGTYRAPIPTTPARTADPDGAEAALRSLLAAVRRDDPSAAARLAPDGDPAAAAQLRALVTNARAVPVADFGMRYVTDDGGVDTRGRWPASVSVAWRYAGFDHGTAHSDVRFVFENAGAQVRIAGIGGSGRTPVWMQGPVQVDRTSGTLVVAARDLAHYAALARAAVPVVHRVLPHWRSHLVVEVPGSQQGLDRALDADDADQYSQIAAVTATVDGTLGAGAPLHVFVNPRVFGSLKGTGAQVVMSHEVVHVATHAATTRAPIWLVEGFADYVALRDVRLPITTTAGQIIREVRRHGAPTSLPGTDDFDTRTTHLGATYEAAWLACRELARTSGESALVDYYRKMQGGADEGTTFQKVFGRSEAAFTRQWRALLEHLAA